MFILIISYLPTKSCIGMLLFLIIFRKMSNLLKIPEGGSFYEIYRIKMIQFAADDLNTEPFSASPDFLRRHPSSGLKLTAKI